MPATSAASAIRCNFNRMQAMIGCVRLARKRTGRQCDGVPRVSPAPDGDQRQGVGLKQASNERAALPHDQPPARWRVVGPGLVVAATGVGAADMVATLVAALVAGSRYGYGLLWAVIAGVILKIILVE
jgi:hypothetical protein